MSKTNRMYLVTGAAGFLGSTVCRKLVEKNERVRAFVLEGDKSAKYLPGEVEISYGDLCNKEDLERFFEMPEGTEVIVLHIASIVTESHGRKCRRDRKYHRDVQRAQCFKACLLLINRSNT